MADGLLPANSFGNVMRREKHVTHRNNKNVGENRNTDRLRDNKKKKRNATMASYRNAEGNNGNTFQSCKFWRQLSFLF